MTIYEIAKVVKQLDFVDYRASMEGANSNDTVE